MRGSNWEGRQEANLAAKRLKHKHQPKNLNGTLSWTLKKKKERSSSPVSLNYITIYIYFLYSLSISDNFFYYLPKIVPIFLCLPTVKKNGTIENKIRVHFLGREIDREKNNRPRPSKNSKNPKIFNHYGQDPFFYQFQHAPQEERVNIRFRLTRSSLSNDVAKSWVKKDETRAYSVMIAVWTYCWGIRPSIFKRVEVTFSCIPPLGIKIRRVSFGKGAEALFGAISWVSFTCREEDASAGVCCSRRWGRRMK